MINFDNLLKLRSIISKIILIAKDIEFKNDNQLSEKIYQIMDMLVHMQSLVISARAELIQKLFAIRPHLPHKTINQVKNGADNIILFDRRKPNPDRRNLHTYLANDRRSGIADRRKRARKLRAEIGFH